MLSRKNTSVSAGSWALAGFFGIATILVIALHCRYLVITSFGIPQQDDWRALAEMFAHIDLQNKVGFVVARGNGHFAIPAKLAYLISWRYFHLDLTPLQLLNIPICLGAFFLLCLVISKVTAQWLMRSYLALGAAFIVFNLNFWEHFVVAGDFTALLSSLLGGIALYFISKFSATSKTRWRDLTLGSLFCLISILSFGIGYAALCASLSFLGIMEVRRWGALPRGTKPWLLIALGGVLLISNPAIAPPFAFSQDVFHTALVAGSLWAGSFQAPFLAQEVAFICGGILLLGAGWIVIHFTCDERRGFLPAFGLGMVLYGAFACLSVSIARAALPNQEFLSPRYTLEPSLALLGALLYFASRDRILLSHVWCFIFFAYLSGTVLENGTAPYRKRVIQAEAETIRHVTDLSDDQIDKTFFWPDAIGIRKVTARLQSEQLNVFNSQRRLP